jgi:hypothetical protein
MKTAKQLYDAEKYKKNAQVYIARAMKRREDLIKKPLRAKISEQNDVCDICGTHIEDGLENSNPHRACLDHDHITGQQRGALCSICNSMLGFACDSIATLNNAVAYLIKWS